MIRIRIIVIDKTREHFIRDAEHYYLKKLRRFIHVQWIELKSVKHGKRSKDEILEMEKHKIQKHISPEDYLVSLDAGGKEFTSEEFAGWFEKLLNIYNGWLSFIIGGPLGLSNDIIKISRLRLSLSRFTFTHEMSRIILLEQIYRAFTIIKGNPYHR
jgi:23S rRNA (pseudouridine1915-N3)-methyltransferase